MRFLRDAVITILLLAMVAATTAVVVVRRGGLSADTEPGRLERSVAARLVRLAIPADADRQQSPLEGQADVWREAREHYLDHCAVRHGRDAKGNTDMGANMHRRCPIDFHRGSASQRRGAVLHHSEWHPMDRYACVEGRALARGHVKLVAFIRKAPTLTEADMKIEEPVATTGEKLRRRHTRIDIVIDGGRTHGWNLRRRSVPHNSPPRPKSLSSHIPAGTAATCVADSETPRNYDSPFDCVVRHRYG